MKGIREAAKEKQAAKTANRKASHARDKLAAVFKGAAACGSDVAAPQAMEDDEITSCQPHPGDNY